MPDMLDALLERHKAHQRTLILMIAAHDGLPAGSALRQVAELENVIAAVEAMKDKKVDVSLNRKLIELIERFFVTLHN